MTASKRKWPVIAGVVFIVGFIAAMIYTSGGNDRFRCQVCKTWEGRTVCSNGAATTKVEAERIATEASCTMLTSGMNNLEQCRNSPAQIAWK